MNGNQHCCGEKVPRTSQRPGMEESMRVTLPRFLAAEDRVSEMASSCSQAGLLGEEYEHELTHKTFDPNLSNL